MTESKSNFHTNDVAVLPPAGKISYIRMALERERRVRHTVLKGDSLVKGIEEMNRCLGYLNDLSMIIK